MSFFGQQSTLLISWTIIIHELGITINKPMCLWNHCKHILHLVGHWGAHYLKTYQDLSGFYQINLGDTTLSTININKPDSCEIHKLNFDVQRDTAKAFPPNSWTCSNLDHLSAYQWVKAPVKYPFQEKVGSTKNTTSECHVFRWNSHLSWLYMHELCVRAKGSWPSVLDPFLLCICRNFHVSAHSRNGFPDVNIKRILGVCQKTLRKPPIPAVYSMTFYIKGL